MKKLGFLAVLILAISLLLIPSVCFADAAGSYHLTNASVTMTEPAFNKVVPTDIKPSSSNITVSNIVWKDSNGKALANTDKITSGGTYTITFDLDRKAGDAFSARTMVYINGNGVGVSRTYVNTNKLTVSKSFTIQGGRLSDAHGKSDYMEGGSSANSLGLIVILLNGNFETGKALPSSFQLKTDIDTTFRSYPAVKATPSSTSTPYAVWQQYDETVQAGKSYTLRYVYPIPSDVTLASEYRVTVDGKEVTPAGLAGQLFFDVTYKAGEQSVVSQIKYVTNVEFENYTFPTAGQELNHTDVKLKSSVPGKIESAAFKMFNKSIGGTASQGETYNLEVKIVLNSGYNFASNLNVSLGGKKPDNIVRVNDSTIVFVWNYTVPASALIKIEEQSPITLEYVEGEDVKLFVKATGVASYQWRKYETTGGAAKQKYAAQAISGATKSEYTIEKASKELDGAQYSCTLTASDKSVAYINTITLKLVDKKAEEPKEEEPKTEEPKTEEVVKVTWAKASTWAIDELTKANNAGLIPVIFDKEDLTQNITRKEFAHVAVKLYEKISGKKAEKVAKNPFTDTKDEEVLKAYNIGITKGMSETTFEPDTLITREQMATMMTRALSEASETINTSVDMSKVKAFADDSEISSWAKESVYFMSNIEIIKGMGDNKFAPKANASREQSLLISVRSAEKYAK